MTAYRDYLKKFFTAICRSIGIAARLNPIDESMEYYDGTKMVSVLEKTKTDASIVVKGEGVHCLAEGLKAGENKEILLSIKSAKLSDMLEEIPITDFELTDQKGEKIMASSLDATNKLLRILKDGN